MIILQMEDLLSKLRNVKKLEQVQKLQKIWKIWEYRGHVCSRLQSMRERIMSIIVVVVE